MKIEPNEMEELRENAHEAGEFMIGTLVVGLSAAEGIAENLVAERDALRAQLSALREQDPVAAVWQAAHLAGQRAIPQPVQDWMLRACIAYAIGQCGGTAPPDEADLDRLAAMLCPPVRGS